jgi:O-antigen/teichoic acid export membrane protein
MLKKIIYNSGVQLIGKAVQLISSVITAALLTRNLGPAGYGQYTLIMALITFLVTLGNWGTQIIGVRELTTREEKSKVFSSLLFLRFVLAGIAIGAGIAFVLISPIFKNIQQLGLLSLILVFSLIIETSFNIIFQSLLKMDRRALINIISSFLFLGLTLVFLNLNYGILAPILSWIITRFTTIIIAYFLSKKILSWSWQPQKDLVKQLFIQSLPLGTLLVLSTAYDQAIDSFVIQQYLGEQQVGFYGLAYKIYSNLVLPAYFLSNTLFPLLSQKKKFNQVLFTGIKLSLIALVGLVPLTFLTAPKIIQVLGGGQFLTSGPILKILSLSLIFAYINHLTGFSLVAINKQKTSLKIGLLALIWNLGLNLYFVPKFGIAAAAWITVSTEGLTSLFSGFFLYKYLKTNN